MSLMTLLFVSVNLDKCTGSCNRFDDLSSIVCVPKNTEDLNLHVFNMIIWLSEWRILTKHISCNCECKFDCTKCCLNQKWNNEKCQCECKNSKKHCVCKKGYFWNPAACSCKNGKYARSIIGDSVDIGNEVLDTTKSSLTKTIPAKCTLTNFYILLAFLLITIALLIAISINLIKHWSKQKYLLPYHDTNKLNKNWN